jgi:hypothetical protein
MLAWNSTTGGWVESSPAVANQTAACIHTEPIDLFKLRRGKEALQSPTSPHF